MKTPSLQHHDPAVSREGRFSRARRLLTQLFQAVEPRVLLAILVCSGAVWGFIALADEVLEGETLGFDEEILIALRNPADLTDPLGPPWLEEVARDVTGFGGVWILSFLILVAAGYLFLSRRPRIALTMFLATTGGFALSFSLKRGFARPRPELVPHETIVYTASFPSGHAMLSAVVYLTIAAMLAQVQPTRRLKAYVLCIAALLTLLIGISRIYLGVHYPTDVFAGWMAGAAWAGLSWLVLRRIAG